MYNLDLQDTVNEIETTINHFDKYGDPKARKQVEAPPQRDQELEWPKKITLSWLFKHAPITLLLKFIGALATAPPSLMQLRSPTARASPTHARATRAVHRDHWLKNTQ